MPSVVVVTYQGTGVHGCNVVYSVPVGADRAVLRSALLRRRNVISVQFAKLGTGLPVHIGKSDASSAK